MVFWNCILNFDDSYYIHVYKPQNEIQSNLTKLIVIRININVYKRVYYL